MWYTKWRVLRVPPIDIYHHRTHAHLSAFTAQTNSAHAHIFSTNGFIIVETNWLCAAVPYIHIRGNVPGCVYHVHHTTSPSTPHHHHHHHPICCVAGLWRLIKSTIPNAPFVIPQTWMPACKHISQQHGGEIHEYTPPDRPMRRSQLHLYYSDYMRTRTWYAF